MKPSASMPVELHDAHIQAWREQLETNSIALRLGFLAYSARWYRDGLYKSAQQAAGSRSVEELLRTIGATGPQNVDERAFLYELLCAIADGRNVVKPLRIEPHKAGHVEASPLNAQIVGEIDALIGLGKEKAAAIAAVAASVKRDPETVRKTYDRVKDKS